jgi:predicted dehydrogenase
MTDAHSVPNLGLGLLGSSFMGRTHSRALALLRTLEDRPAALPLLRTICGRDQGRLDAMQRRYGWERTTRDWRDLLADTSIDLFDNAAPNQLHAEPTIAAVEAGKHVLCEKPLGRDAQEAHAMWRAADKAGVVHMTAFNYRFFPAVSLARQLIAAGEIGEPRQFRSRFLLASGALPESEETPWRLQRESAGSGVVGDLLAHHVDLARHLVGEPIAVSAVTRGWSARRSGVAVDVEDAVACTMEFAAGAIGTLEAARMAPGHVLDSVVEVDGSEGSLRFDLQRLNELRVSDLRHERTINVTEAHHPYIDLWWPRGQGIGWGDSFVHELRHFLGAAAGAWPVEPEGATFFDGLRCAETCDAILAAAASGRRELVGKSAAAGGSEQVA